MDLNIVWFILISVLFLVFFILEGFDFGVGILLPFVAKSDTERRQVLNAIGPTWDVNEVWLITAGGAMFAAFPNWYATMFSGYYLALVLMLVALIFRGMGFEFRSKVESSSWRRFWDWAIFAGSFVPALLWGVVLGNTIAGVPIDGQMNYTGGFFNLLNPYALLGGLCTVSLFTMHGGIFLHLKTSEHIQERALTFSRLLWLPSSLLVFAFVGFGYLVTDSLSSLGLNPGAIPLGAGIALLAIGPLLKRGMSGWAFLMSIVTILFSVSTIFIALFPNVMLSSSSPENHLTIYNASSSDYTLKTMFIVVLCCLPVVLGYVAWAYWVFRKRITPDSELEY